jgi:hypothetical protein
MDCLFLVLLGKGPYMSIPHWMNINGEDIVVSLIESCVETNTNF